jgi:hypothetical protein
MLLVSQDHLMKRPDLDFFLASMFVAEVAQLGNRLDEIKELGPEAKRKLAALSSMPDDQVSATVYELLVGTACVRKGLTVTMVPEDRLRKVAGGPGNRGGCPIHSRTYFANEWALRAAVVSKRFHRTSFDLQRPLLKVHSYQTRIATPVGPKTAPPPLVRLLYQPSIHRIAMHIAQLLDPLAFSPHVEIIETFLPYRVRRRIAKRNLGRNSPFSKLVQAPRKPVFDDLHHHGRIAHFRLGDEQMKMFRHYDISVHHEAILAARFFQDRQKEIATFSTSQLRLAAVATAGYKMQILVSVIANESLGHPISVPTGLKADCDPDTV